MAGNQAISYTPRRQFPVGTSAARHDVFSDNEHYGAGF